ncbi:MAG: hypothetical protein G01um101431_538 [Parcubacteria group bacterium Gr01-1014_31]|nr:MAG: hypothetical protein G01um101431_538 [Parcubacteria group bacterium Gr01-1014_31]
MVGFVVMTPQLIFKSNSLKFSWLRISWNEMPVQMSCLITQESIIQPIGLKCFFDCISKLTQNSKQLSLFFWRCLGKIQGFFTITPNNATPKIALILMKEN